MPDVSSPDIAIVLVHPKLPANIGAAARAMKNMGLSDLRLVHPPLDRKGDAARLAHGANDVLDGAMKVFEVEEALADVQYTVGTTARLGGWRKQIVAPREIAGELMHTAKTNKVAVLFGAEDSGLPNEVIKRCNRLISVPTARPQRSLNLAQAVLLVAYELRLAALPDKPAQPKLAAVQNVEGMFQDLAEALQLINFMRPGNPEYWLMAFKRLFARTGLTDPEVNMFRGIARQIRWLHGRTVKAETRVDELDGTQSAEAE